MTEIRCKNKWHGHKCNRLLMKFNEQSLVEKHGVINWNTMKDEVKFTGKNFEGEIQCPKCGEKTHFFIACPIKEIPIMGTLRSKEAIPAI